MAVRPNSSKKENIQSVAEAVIYAFATYGFPRGNATGTRPVSTEKESIKSVGDAVAWAWT